MPGARRKIGAALKDFRSELNRLERLDRENQTRFAASGGLSKTQLHVLTEAVFFTGYRSYETLVRDVFLLYSLERPRITGARVRSYLKPRDFAHAEELIQSSMRYLDWTNPDEMIRRAELYLKDGGPIKLVYTTHLQALKDFRTIRNRIAHDSKESLGAYKKVLVRHYGAVPLVIPRPGEFLLIGKTSHPTKYNLQTFFEVMGQVATAIS